MKKSKKVLALAITALMCLSLLAACGGDNSSSDPTTTGTESASPNAPIAPGQVAPTEAAPTGDDVVFAEEIIIIMDNNAVTVLNPFITGAGAPANSWTSNLMYDRLVYPIGDGKYDPYLAKDWDIEVTDSGAMVFTFELREDVYFHNGENMTANDVVFTINTAKEDMTGTNHGYWHPTGIDVTATALDQYTVRIELDQIYIDYLFNLSLPYCMIVSEKAMRDDPDNGYAIGTGAFYLTEFVSGNYHVVERNDNYWGEPPITRKITFRFIPEPGTRTIMMINNEAQLCFGIGGEDMEVFEDSPDYQMFPFTFNNAMTLNFNMEHPILSDWNFRMAVASALDRAEIAIVAAGTYSAPNYTGTVWGYETEFRNDNLEMIPEDLDAARAYLEASVYNGEPIEIATSIITFTRAAEVIQQQLARIGIDIVLEVMDGPGMTSYTDPNNNQSEITLNVVVFTEVASSYRGFVYPGSNGNRVMYNNERVKELFDLAVIELNDDLRRSYYYEIQEILAHDIPRVEMFFRMNAAVSVPGIGGFALPSTALYDFRYIYWQIEG